MALVLAASACSVAEAQLVLSLTTAAAGTVTIPAGYDWTNVTVQCWGGGGGGGGDAYGGGGGAYSGKAYTTPLVAGPYSYYVGAGGLGGTTISVPGVGSSGGSTVWNYGGADDIVAGGGGGGGNNTGYGGNGVGGTVGAGTGFSGGGGGAYYANAYNGNLSYFGAGGGGAGGPGGPGGQGGDGTSSSGGSGGTGSAPGGSGGSGGGGNMNFGSPGANGSFPGGGGGGSSGPGNYYGGQGGNGEIVVTYTQVYCGQVAWSASGGGSWGTLTTSFGTNWGGTGYGSPGLSTTFPDSAALGSSVPSGTATVTLDGASPYLAALTISNSAASYTLAAGSGGTLQMNGGATAAALTDSAGSHMISAPVALDTSAVVTVANPASTLTISGPISGSGGLTKGGAGTVVLTANNTFAGGMTISAGTLALGGAGTADNLMGNVTNNSTLVFNLTGNQFFSANISGPGSIVANGPGTLVLRGTVSAGQIAVNQAEIAAAAGSMVSGNLMVGASANFTNNGSTDYFGNLTNGGIFAGNAQVSGSFSNSPTGTVRIAPGQSLFLQGAFSQSNAGLIQLIGTASAQAQFESAGPLSNAAGTGLITGQNATVNFDSGLTNQGSVAFSYGISNVSGSIANAPGGNITVTGGAGVTFYGDVGQNGTLVVATVGGIQSSAVFLGSFSGSGGFTGGGDVFIDGNLRPSDPVAVTFGGNAYLANSTDTVMQLGGTVAGSGYDQINCTGQLALAGALDVELIDGFQPRAGEAFDLFNGGLSGEFSQLSLPALSDGLSWNTSNLDTTGQISVVPEPSTLALLAAGAVGVLKLSRRQRRKSRYAHSRNDGTPVTLRFPSSGACAARRAA